ncbi:MAG: kelch repeat-containing protein [Candidatus Krumholzibacteria bacterium]|nr:kelch repeat-containing protein [Candidatus Krumholzibacteria bacterium]
MTLKSASALMIILSLFFLTSCENRVVEPETHVWTPASLGGTVNDSLLFLSVYLGDPDEVARFSWDFNSDGIFDRVVMNNGWGIDTLEIYTSYGNPGSYVATLQVTTDTNQLYRRTSEVLITDQLPLLSITAPSQIACGDTLFLSGTVIDDAGSSVWWDLDNNGSPDLFESYSDTATLEATHRPEGPGMRPLAFGASDNDYHVVEEVVDLVVGLEPEWVETDSTFAFSPMTDGRWAHASVTWEDRIYVFGGRSLNIYSDSTITYYSTEIYDPLSDTWAAGANMPTARWLCRAETIGDKIYVIGGYLPDGSVFRGAEAYDPLSDTWAPASEFGEMDMAKIGFSMSESFASGQEGKIALFGGSVAGSVNDTTLVFDPASGNWNRDLGSFIRTPRSRMSSLLADGKIWTMGGIEDASLVSEVAEYSPFDGRWIGSPDLLTPRFDAAIVLHGRHIYLLGGRGSSGQTLDSVEIFDLDTDQWHEGPRLPVARSGASAHAIGERIYLVGGHGPDSETGSRDVHSLIPWRCED